MNLIVYSGPGCPDCRVAKRFLVKHNLPFTEIDIETTPGAADEVVQRTGKRAIPQFVIDGEWVQPYRPGEGFLYEEMAERLGVSLHDPCAEPGLQLARSSQQSGRQQEQGLEKSEHAFERDAHNPKRQQ